MPGKTDGNQANIVAGLRRIGASVTCTHEVRHGYPDICVGFRGETYLIEVKQPGHADDLTVDELRWHGRWCGQVAICTTLEEALQAIGAL